MPRKVNKRKNGQKRAKGAKIAKGAKNPPAKNSASTSPSTWTWRSLPRPFFALAPMANVTDAAFRGVFAKYGKPDVMWTEFVSADGLMHADSAGKKRLKIDLQFSEKERPILAQLFTGHPAEMKGAAKLVAEMGFDGVDINMGCPDRSVERQGGGAALMKDPDIALEVIRSAREGARGIPVSVKTRIGYNKENIDEWIGKLLSIEPQLPALTVHLRTRKEMSDAPAHWELMSRVVALRDRIQAHIPADTRTLIIGNGDVGSLNDAYKKAKETGCDGVMIGRGIFGAPWFFEKLVKARKSGKSGKNLAGNRASAGAAAKSSIDAAEKSPEERLRALLEHTKLFAKLYSAKNRATSKRANSAINRATSKTARPATAPTKNFATMKKHFKAYVSGWDGAKELRAKLMETENAKQVEKVVADYLRLH